MPGMLYIGFGKIAGFARKYSILRISDIHGASGAMLKLSKGIGPCLFVHGQYAQQLAEPGRGKFQNTARKSRSDSITQSKAK